MRAPRALRAAAGVLAVSAFAGAIRAQDSCATAVPIAADITVVGSSTTATSDGAAVCAAATSRDVWYVFTPGVSGIHTISLCGSLYDTVLSVHQACGAFPVACNDNSCGGASQVVTSLVAGTPYYLRVAEFGAAGAGGTYSVTVTSPSVSSPVNNACSSATTLEAGIPFNGTTVGATGSDVSPCGGADNGDVWFAYFAQATGPHVVSVCSASMDTVVSVHASCFGAVLACDDNSPTSCGPSGSQVAFNAAQGTSYRIRVAGTSSAAGTFSITVHAPVQNDLCSAAIPLSLGNSYSGQTNPTTSSEGVAPCAGATGLDVWHTFTATASGPHTISLCASAFDTALTVYSACPGSGGAPIACANDECGTRSQLTLPLVSGTAYWLRVAGVGAAAASGAYSINVAFAQPSNDLCTGASPLAVDVPVTGSTTGATGVDETGCGPGDTRDVWYAFSPVNSGLYEFNTCGSAVNTTLAVFESCGAPPLACADDNLLFCGEEGDDTSLLVNLTGGTMYLVRVAAVGGAQGTFRLVAFAAPPFNDQCGAALPLPINSHFSGTTTGGSGIDQSACGEFDTVDVWFSVTPAVDGYYQISACGSPGDSVLSLHASCASASFACSDNDPVCGSGALDGRISAFLTAGQATYVRLAHENGLGGAYTISVMLAPPPNDTCATATTLPFDTPMLATTVGATGTDTTPCGTADARDVWFRFIPPATGTYRVTTCVAVNSLDTTLSLWDACSGSPIACADSEQACGGGNEDLAGLSVELDANQPVFVRIAGEDNAEGVFGVQARFARPVNDTCQTALPVSEGTHLFETWGATTDAVSFNAPCGGGLTSLVRDVWFRYQPSASGDARFNLCGSTFDTYMVISDAGLGCPVGIYPILACNDDFDCDGLPSTLDRQSSIVFPVSRTLEYFIHIGSRTDSPGQGMLSINVSPGACPCDWNGVGGLSTQDVYDFLADWLSGDGDFNRNGATSVQDIYDYLTCFSGGC